MDITTLLVIVLIVILLGGAAGMAGDAGTKRHFPDTEFCRLKTNKNATG